MRPAFLARSAISRHRHIHPTDDNMSQANGSRTDHFFSNLKAQVSSARFTLLPIPMPPSRRAGMASSTVDLGSLAQPRETTTLRCRGLIAGRALASQSFGKRLRGCLVGLKHSG